MKYGKKQTFGLGLLMLLMMIQLCSCTPKTQDEEIELLDPVSVAVLSTEVSYGDLFDVSVMDGYVVPLTQEIQMEVNSTMGHLEVFLGQHVEEGQTLLTLDVDTTRKEAEKLQKQLEYQLQADLLENQQKELAIQIAEKELERLRYYGYADSLITKKQMEVEELELELKHQKSLQSLQIQKMKKENREKQEELSVQSIQAPASGTICYIAPVQEGDRLSRLDVLFALALDHQYLVETEFVPQSTYEQADKTEARIGAGSYQLDYQPMDPKEYIARKLANKVVHSFYAFSDETSEVRSGDYAAVLLYNRVREHVLTIPSSALYQDEAGRYVYVIQEDGSRVRREVSIGVTTRIGCEVTGGLMEGERVYVKE